MRQPKLTEIDIWKRHENEVIYILTEALNAIREQITGSEKEDEITRHLYLKMRSINNMRLKNGKGIANTLSMQMPNQPRYDDKPGNTRERKKPDMQWGFVDIQTNDPDLHERQYCIECKWLGKPLKRQAQYYVNDGILRFVSSEYGYGKGENSGAMVAYIKNLNCDDILKEINSIVKTKGLNEIFLDDGTWKEGKVTHLTQILDRLELLPNVFCLKHLWADYRKPIAG